MRYYVSCVNNLDMYAYLLIQFTGNQTDTLPCQVVVTNGFNQMVESLVRYRVVAGQLFFFLWQK